MPKTKKDSALGFFVPDKGKISGSQDLLFFES